MNAASAALLAFLAGSAALLQGCGCSEDDETTCVNAYTDKVTAYTTAQISGDDETALEELCSGINTLGTCLSDAGCCDEYDVDSAVSTYDSVCTGDNAVSNKCS